MKRKIGFMIVFVMLVCMTGCGSSKSSYEMDSATTVTNSSDMWESESYAEEATEDSTSDSGVVVDINRKLIKTVNMSVETKQFDELLTNLKTRCEELGGYIEEQNVYNGSSYYGRNTTRNAYLVLRIPVDQLDAYLFDVESQGNVVSRNETVQDVTLSYVDMQSRKEALIVEQVRLMELLEQAESVEDLITIESRLSDVRYQIESMESQLRTYDNQIDYSTVYMDVNEVENLTQVEEESTGKRIVREFSENAKSAFKGIKEFAIGILVNLPYIIEWAIIIVVIVLVIRTISRHQRKKKNKVIENQENKEVENDK